MLSLSSLEKYFNEKQYRETVLLYSKMEQALSIQESDKDKAYSIYSQAVDYLQQELVSLYKKENMPLVKMENSNESSFYIYYCKALMHYCEQVKDYFTAIQIAKDSFLDREDKSIVAKLKSYYKIISKAPETSFFKLCENSALFFKEQEDKIANLILRNDDESLSEAEEIVLKGLNIAFFDLKVDDVNIYILSDRDDEIKEHNFLNYDEEKAKKGDDLEEERDTVVVNFLNLDDFKKTHLFYYYSYLLNDAGLSVISFKLGQMQLDVENQEVEFEDFKASSDDCLVYINFDEEPLSRLVNGNGKMNEKNMPSKPFIHLTICSKKFYELSKDNFALCIDLFTKLLNKALGSIVSMYVSRDYRFTKTKFKNVKGYSLNSLHEVLQKHNITIDNDIALFMFLNNINYSSSSKSTALRPNVFVGESRLFEILKDYKEDSLNCFEFLYKRGVLPGTISFELSEFNDKTYTNKPAEILNDLRNFSIHILNKSIYEIGVAKGHSKTRRNKYNIYLDVLSFESRDLKRLKDFFIEKRVQKAAFTPLFKGSQSITLVDSKTYIKEEKEYLKHHPFLRGPVLNDLMYLFFDDDVYKNTSLSFDVRNKVFLLIENKDYIKAYSVLYSHFATASTDDRESFINDPFCALITGLLANHINIYILQFRAYVLLSKIKDKYANNIDFIALYIKALLFTGHIDEAFAYIQEHKEYIKTHNKKYIKLTLFIVAIYYHFKEPFLDFIESAYDNFESLNKQDNNLLSKLEESSNDLYNDKEPCDIFNILNLGIDYIDALHDKDVTFLEKFLKIRSSFNSILFNKEGFIDVIRKAEFDLSYYLLDSPICYFKMEVDNLRFDFVFSGNKNAMSNYLPDNEEFETFLTQLKSGALNKIQNDNNENAYLQAVIYKLEDDATPCLIYKKEIYKDDHYFFFHYQVDRKSLNGPIFYEEDRSLDEIILRNESLSASNNADDLMPLDLQKPSINNIQKVGLLNRKSSVNTSRFMDFSQQKESTFSLALTTDDKVKGKKDSGNKTSSHYLICDDINC